LSLNLTDGGIFLTIQGEGLFLGCPSVFVRLSGCNLRCQWRNQDGSETLCDTPYSSFEPETNIKSVEQVLHEILEFSVDHIVITGGEPTIQNDVFKLISLLRAAGKTVTLETNGTNTIQATGGDDFLVSISPKLASSCQPGSKYFKMHQAKRVNMQTLASIVKSFTVQFKFVMNSKEDLLEVREILSSLARKYISKENIFLMPQGITSAQLDERSQWLIEICKETGYRFADRAHIRLFGHTRGT
jgi:7-carboxy-7-deazaguanine synthase